MADFRIHDVHFSSAQKLLDFSSFQEGKKITNYSTKYQPYLEQILSEYEKLIDPDSDYDTEDLREKVRWPSHSANSNTKDMQGCLVNLFAAKQYLQPAYLNHPFSSHWRDKKEKPLAVSEELKQRICIAADRSAEINQKIGILWKSIQDKDSASFDLNMRIEPKKFLGFENELGQTALHLAVESGESEFVNSLLDYMRPKDLSILESNNRCYSAFHLACVKGNKEMAELLYVTQPSLLSQLTGWKYTSLHLAVSSGSVEIVELLLEKLSPEQVNTPNRFKTTPLQQAIVSGNVEILKCFLKFDANFKKEILEQAQKQMPEKYGPDLSHVLEKFELKEEQLAFLKRTSFLSCVDFDAESEYAEVCAYVRGQLEGNRSIYDWYNDQKQNQKMQKVIDAVSSYTS